MTSFSAGPARHSISVASLLSWVETWYFDQEVPGLIDEDLDADDVQDSDLDDARFESARRTAA